MAPINTLSVLAFATAALAVPYHGHAHSKYHNNKPSGFSSYPYPIANGTGLYPTGTGLATGSAVAPASETVVVSDVETTTAVAATTTYEDASTTCVSDVTVTTTVKKTVTVTPGASSAQAATSSSSEAAPVEASSQYSAPAYSAASSSQAAPVESAVESSAPAYSAAPTSYSSKVEAVTQAASSAPASSAPATTSSASSSVEESSSAASPTMTYAAANKNIDVNIGYGSSSSASSSSAAPSASSYSSGSSKSGKRGVAYNDASLTDCLISSPAVSWGFNWGSSSAGLSSSVKYIPTMWGLKPDFTNGWSDAANKAIESGSTHLFSFNEPDLPAQANMSPEDAASAWKTYMEPFAGKAKLCAPSVTNGGGDMGLTWLSNFMESCSDCTIDCVNIHWYDSAENTDYFKSHIGDAAKIAGDRKIFISEFGATGSDDQISSFLEEVMPWMDSNDSVDGYAYFMASEGKLVSGGEQSAIGKTYAS